MQMNTRRHNTQFKTNYARVNMLMVTSIWNANSDKFKC